MRNGMQAGVPTTPSSQPLIFDQGTGREKGGVSEGSREIVSSARETDTHVCQTKADLYIQDD